MKSIKYSLTIVAILNSFHAIAQSESAIAGQAKKITFTVPDATSKCNIEVTLPDQKKIGVEVEPPQYLASFEFTPNQSGPNNITWEGKNKIRDLDTVSGCSGSGALQVLVSGNVAQMSQRWNKYLASVSEEVRSCMQVGMDIYKYKYHYSTDPNAVLISPDDPSLKPLYEKCDGFAKLNHPRIATPCTLPSQNNLKTICDGVYAERQADGKLKAISRSTAIQMYFDGKPFIIGIVENAAAKADRLKRDAERPVAEEKERAATANPRWILYNNGYNAINISGITRSQDGVVSYGVLEKFGKVVLYNVVANCTTGYRSADLRIAMGTKPFHKEELSIVCDEKIASRANLLEGELDPAHPDVLYDILISKSDYPKKWEEEARRAALAEETARRNAEAARLAEETARRNAEAARLAEETARRNEEAARKVAAEKARQAAIEEESERRRRWLLTPEGKKHTADEAARAAREQAAERARLAALGPPKFKVTHGRSWSDLVRRAMNTVVIQSLDGNVFVRKVIINRGGCEVTYVENGQFVSNLPARMNFGDVLRIPIEGCSILEVSIDTDRGKVTFNTN